MFPGESDLARLMRAHDWASTPLGAAEGWPEGLKVPLRMMLTSRFEMWLGWGPDLAFFYNDAYLPTLGAKHPWAIGRPVREVWAEIFEEVEGRFRSVLEQGIPTWDRALMLLLERRGYPEETYHTFSYSPLRGDGDAVEGLMCVVTEDTERVINERRLDTLQSLAHALAEATTQADVLSGLRTTLLANRRDFPFNLTYLRGADGRWAGHAGCPEAAPLLGSGWPLAELERGGSEIRIALDGARACPPCGGSVISPPRGDVEVSPPCGDVEISPPCGVWKIPPNEALLTPIASSAIAAPFGALVLGLNPHRREDPDISGFAQLIAGQVAGALAKINALELERRRADRIWAHSRDLIVVLDADGIFRSVSPSWTAILGHLPEEVVGHDVHEFIHPDDTTRTQGALETAAGGDQLTAFENRYLSKSGDVRWISWHTTVEDDLIYAYGRDTTDSKAQAETLQAVEEALRQSQKMEAVGQLTGGIAHDFNNLLTGIAGSLELMQSRVSQGRFSELERYIVTARGAAGRAAALTHRLLAFSRQQTLDAKSTNINRLVSGMEELVRRTMGPAVTVEIVAAGGLWTTLADPNQLENALLNLCINARDAMPSGGRVTVETGNIWLDERVARERDLPPGHYVSLCVSDTGTGMPPEVIARAFDPFFTTKPIGQGSGLGLSMIYGFARQSGGHTRIYSEVGQGTTVCIYLPRHRGEETDGAEASPETERPPESLSGETVLVVDDEPTVRMLVADVLSELGYNAIEATDGPSGLRVLESPARIHLMVTDFGLPGGMNGRQLAQAARLARPELKVLFITGYAENAALSHGHLEPGMHVLTKPFAMDHLATRISAIIVGG